MKIALPSDKHKITSLILRAGLAFVFLYAALGSFMHPAEWVGYLPSFLLKTNHGYGLLQLFAVFEVALSAWLLSGWRTRYAALLGAAMLGGIVLAQPSAFIITFRDAGLAAMALALAAHDW